MEHYYPGYANAGRWLQIFRATIVTLRMDTDDLSKETYSAILVTAERFDHNLTLQFGLLSYECNDDSDYLNSAAELIAKWQDNIEKAIPQIFFDVPHPKRDDFISVLRTIQQKIDQVRLIPVSKRKFEF